MELAAFADLLAHQCGIVSRQQLLEGGAADIDIRRWQRNRHLKRVHHGVYVDHTGPLTWEQRAWAAVQLHWPAALSHQSCLHRDSHPIHVAVDATRSPRPTPGVRVHRLCGLDGRVLWNLAPPRLRIEDAALAVARATTTACERSP